MRTKMLVALRKSPSAMVVMGMAAVAGLGAEPSAQLVLAQRFAVTVSNCQNDLGSWPKVTGLDATMDLAEYHSGGRAISFPRYLKPSLNEGTVTLSRSASSESELVQEWLAQWQLSFEPVPVGITLIDDTGQPLTSWELSGVVPLHWQISAVDPSRFPTATEVLVLAHEGVALERPASRCEPIGHANLLAGPFLVACPSP